MTSHDTTQRTCFRTHTRCIVQRRASAMLGCYAMSAWSQSAWPRWVSAGLHTGDECTARLTCAGCPDRLPMPCHGRSYAQPALHGALIEEAVLPTHSLTTFHTPATQSASSASHTEQPPHIHLSLQPLLLNSSLPHPSNLLTSSAPTSLVFYLTRLPFLFLLARHESRLAR